MTDEEKQYITLQSLVKREGETCYSKDTPYLKNIHCEVCLIGTKTYVDSRGRLLRAEDVDKY